MTEIKDFDDEFNKNDKNDIKSDLSHQGQVSFFENIESDNISDKLEP